MSEVNALPTSCIDRLGSMIVDENSDAERQLCGMVDAVIATSNRVLQRTASDVNSSATVAKAASHFRANGILISSDNPDENALSAASPAATESSLRAQLEHCRSLLRRVDTERRHLRNQCIYLQKEQGLRRAEMESMHRYSTESNQRSQALERQVAEERRRRRQLQEEADAQTEEVMRLRRVLRALPADVLRSLNPSPFTGGAWTEVVQALVPDRRFEVAFRDKMNSIVYKRRYRQASAMHQAASEHLETLMMEQQDPLQVVERLPYVDEGVPAVGATSAESVVGWEGRGRGGGASSLFESQCSQVDDSRPDGLIHITAASTFAGSALLHSALEFPSQLPFTTTNPKDVHIKFLVYHSMYAEPLTQLREHVLRLSSRLKTVQDTGLRALYAIFTQLLHLLGSAHTLAQWRFLYQRQMEKMQRVHRDLLYAVMEQANMAATQIPELERAASAGSAQRDLARGAAERRDVGCSAHESTTMDAYRTSQLKEQLAHLKRQLLEAESVARKEKEEMGRQCSSARQGALQALQSLRALSKCVMSSVQVQGAADDAVYDPFAQLSDPLIEELLDDPRLGTKTAEATDLIISYVRLLACSGAGGSRGKSSQRLCTAPGAAPLSFSRMSGAEGTQGEVPKRLMEMDGTAIDPTTPSCFPKARFSRRQSAPSTVQALRHRTRSSSWSRPGRRVSAPQLPPMPRTKAFLSRAKCGGELQSSGAAASAHCTPATGNLSSPRTPPLSSLCNTTNSQKAPTEEKGPTPQATVTVIQLGFRKDCAER
ncbi:hypothetical protein LSCM1_03706 [Leishmania martiniquensis]|uniref:Uncharacterized protein n=1 Tax=Leishmania martiniquensis TaxID=1580590 RepID=A0A836GQV7_9TRYP|nr:hypothetical protein LSCM1_03706 [Leishmania martiniquensis]